MFSVDELHRVMKLDYPRQKLIDWRPIHLQMIELNEFDARTVHVFDGFSEYINAYATHGIAYTAIVDGRVLGMFGIYQLWSGVGEAWLIPSRHIQQKTFSFHRAALRFFDYVPKKMKLKRLQITVCSSNGLADRWANRCYFNREGLLKRYGPEGSDYWMYARLYDG